MSLSPGRSKPVRMVGGNPDAPTTPGPATPPREQKLEEKQDDVCVDAKQEEVNVDANKQEEETKTVEAQEEGNQEEGSPPEEKKKGDPDEMMFLVEQLLDGQEQVRVLTEELAAEKKKLQDSESRTFLTQLREAGTTPWSSDLLHLMAESFGRVQGEGAAGVFRRACVSIASLVHRAKNHKAVSLGSLKSHVVDFLAAVDTDVKRLNMIYHAQNGGYHHRAEDASAESKIRHYTAPTVPQYYHLKEGLMAVCVEEFDKVLSVRAELLSLLVTGVVPEEYLVDLVVDQTSVSRPSTFANHHTQQQSDPTIVTPPATTPEMTPHATPERHSRGTTPRGGGGGDSAQKQQQQVPPLRLIAPAVRNRQNTAALLPVSGRRTSSTTPRPRLNAVSTGAHMTPPPTVVFTVESRKATGPVSFNVRPQPGQEYQRTSSNVANNGDRQQSPVRTPSSGRGRGKAQTPGRRGAPMASEYDEDDEEDAEWGRLASLSYRPRNTTTTTVVTSSSRAVELSGGGPVPRAGSALKKPRTTTSASAASSSGSGVGGSTTRTASAKRHVGFRGA